MLMLCKVQNIYDNSSTKVWICRLRELYNSSVRADFQNRFQIKLTRTLKSVKTDVAVALAVQLNYKSTIFWKQRFCFDVVLVSRLKIYTEPRVFGKKTILTEESPFEKSILNIFLSTWWPVFRNHYSSNVLCFRLTETGFDSPKK